MLGAAALLLGILGVGMAAAGDAIGNSRFAGQNAVLRKRLAEGNFNPEEEDRLYAYVKKYKCVPGGKSFLFEPYGKGTNFPGGVEHRDLYHLMVYMKEQGYDCKRYIIWTSVPWGL